LRLPLEEGTRSGHTNRSTTTYGSYDDEGKRWDNERCPSMHCSGRRRFMTVAQLFERAKRMEEEEKGCTSTSAIPRVLPRF
jgi:hypothetical protein